MTIFVIAGPPGIGKSTNAKYFVPIKTPIIDQDLAGYQYKKLGFTDYTDLASITSNQKIKDYLFGRENFALELNLGFQSHYDYLKSIIAFDKSNTVNLIIFFTDSLNLCLDRARIRHLSGGHEVKEAVIEEMYRNTFSLFRENRELFDNVLLVDVTDNSVLPLTKNTAPNPTWVSENQMTEYLIQ